jgi:hypothetical protein
MAVLLPRAYAVEQNAAGSKKCPDVQRRDFFDKLCSA